MFTNIIQRISGLVSIFFPKKIQLKAIHPQKTKSKYALYTYRSVKKDILSLKHGKFSKITDDFAQHLLCIHNASATILIYIPSTTHLLGVKGTDHMKEFVLQYEKVLSPNYTICIDTLGILDTHIQHTLGRKDRIRYAKEKFYITDLFNEYIRGNNIKHIVCIDDVTTTGATREAVEILFSKYNICIQFIAIASQD